MNKQRVFVHFKRQNDYVYIGGFPYILVFCKRGYPDSYWGSGIPVKYLEHKVFFLLILRMNWINS